MKIAINGLSVIAGGGLTYLFNLLPALGRLDRENQYGVLLSRFNAGLMRGLPANFEAVTINLPFRSNLLRGIYEQSALTLRLRKEGYDLLYSPADITSLRSPCPVVLAMRNPNLYAAVSPSWGLPNQVRLRILKMLARLSARKADRIIFVSEASRREVSSRLNIPLRKSVAIHHGIDPDAFRRGRVKALPRWLPRRYLLSISTVYHYKNFLPLMEAYRRLREGRGDAIPDLVIAGRNADGPYYRRMEEFIATHSLGGHIHLAGDFSYQMVPSLYAGAEIFVFPSYLETFGHPSLEAMAAGVPVAAADLPVMREVLGDAAAYFDPHEPAEMASTLASLLDDGEARENLRRQGLERIKKFTWDRTARQTLDLFTATLGKQR